MPRNLVVCLDGTANEPESGLTNVVRSFDIAVKADDQIVYYDPGVGTMGARSATTRLGKRLTVLSGLLMGHGINENLEEAYTWLTRNYQAHDRIFIFGFSRGAYTALALTGILRTIGLLRAGADNLVPYAIKLYTRSGKPGHTEEQEKLFWAERDRFNRSFGNPDFNPFARRITYLGMWDAVKTVGWLNWRARFEEACWPFTRKITGVRAARHALAIDEKRRPYAEYRLDKDLVRKRAGELQEMWFAGIHSDVGGYFEDHRLSDLALAWVIDGAIDAGLQVDPKAYEAHLGVEPGTPLPDDHCLGRIHGNEWPWALVGLGWRRRVIRSDDEVHPSVHARIAATREAATPYTPRLPST